MKPILVELFGWPLRGYGAFVGAALVIGMTLVMRHGRRIGVAPQGLLDAAFASVVGGLAGGRLLYVAVHAREFAGDPLGALRLWEGGMMYFGGLLVGMVTGIVVAIRRGLVLWPALDTVAPALGPGQALGRMACLIAACCYGPEHHGAFAVTFTDPASSVPSHLLGVPLLPVQVLQIGEGLLLWAIGAWAFRRRRWDGQAFLLVMGAAGLTRFVLEGLRDDDARGFLLEARFGHTFSTSRVLGLAMIAGAIVGWVWRARTHAAPVFRPAPEEGAVADPASAGLQA